MSATRPVLVGLDVGTSAAKIVALDTDGRILARGQLGYDLSYPRPGWVELDPDAVWQACRYLLRQLCAQLRPRRDIAALAVSVSGDDALFVDRAGRPIGAAIMALDVRSQAEGSAFAKQVGADRLHRLTGLPAAAVHPLVRLLWLRSHDRAAFERVDRVMGWGEWIAHRLGVAPLTDPSQAARTMAWDVRRGGWSAELLERAGLPADIFPPVVASGRPMGVIGQAAADGLGLGPGVVLATGGLDQYVAALGAGCSRPADAMVGTGSWEALTVIIDRPLTGPALADAGYAVGPYVVGNRYAAMATSVGGGMLVRWLGDLLGGQSAGRLLARLPQRPTSLLVLPHLQGSYSPWLDPRSSAAVVGIGLATTRGELVKAALEGITFELLENVTRLEQAGIEIGTVRCTGGGARSSAWLQLKADILDRPVTRLSTEDTGAIGAACLAGAASGHFASAVDAARRAVRVERVFEPRPGQRDAYRESFERYRRLYPELRALR